MKAAQGTLPSKRHSKDGEVSDGPRSSRTTSGTRRRRTRTAAHRGDLPDIDLSEEDFLKEWGITKDQEEKLLTEYRQILETEVGEPLKPLFDKYYLRRYLRARQHDLQRAKDMFMAHLKWRADMGVDTIQDTLHFHERDAFLSLYPQGYHKTDRLGRPVYIQHLGQINIRALQSVTTEERMLLFHIQEYERALRYIFPACSLVAGRHISQTLAVMDLKGVGLRHLSGDVKRILGSITRTDQDNYPETLGKTLIINAPTVFRAIWTVVKPMLDPRTQAKIQVCSGDYMPELTRWVAIENIPSYLGGQSQGSLLDDVGPWHDDALRAEIDAQRARLVSVGGGDGGGGESPLGGIDNGGGGGASYSIDSEAMVLLPPSGGGGGGVVVVVGEDDDGDGDDEFHDALTRRLSTLSTMSSVTSAYMSADEGGYLSTDSQATTLSSQRVVHVGVPATAASSDGESMLESPAASKMGAPGGQLLQQQQQQQPVQISILARVRALEDRLPEVERPVRRHLSPTEPVPSGSVGQGTLVGRVAALEKAMDTLLKAQEVVMEEHEDAPVLGRGGGGGGGGSRCCACCSIM